MIYDLIAVITLRTFPENTVSHGDALCPFLSKIPKAIEGVYCQTLSETAFLRI